MRTSGLVERLAAMAERRLPALTPQQLAETLDALARLEFHAPKSFLKARLTALCSLQSGYHSAESTNWEYRQDAVDGI